MERPNSGFATTQWTLVWKAAEEDSQHGRPALAEVIRRYWMPLYGFARKRGLSSEDAEDATQEFLAEIMNGTLLETADPAQGKFRSYLLTAWKRFLVDDYRKKTADKRGGAAKQLSLDVSAGEQEWLHLQSREPDADRLFIRSWADSLLDDVRGRLRQEYAQRGKRHLFETLVSKLTSEVDGEAYMEIAVELGMKPGTVKVALFRLRQRFGNALRDAISETVDDPTEVDREIQELLTALSDR